MSNVRQVQFGRNGGASSKGPSAEETEQGNIVDMGAFRTRKSLASDRKVSVGEAFSGNAELSDRIERIKSSINRINLLMSELKSVSKDEDGRK
jgi:hypothetical protein